MGLGARRKRVKISHDPNNTQWSRSSTKYGQKILEAQGWNPGESIGTNHSPKTALATTAGTVSSRVVLKEDTLGLGARYGGTHDDPGTGLAGFQDLLGRLNGKSEERLQKDKVVRATLSRGRYLERRGIVHFVKGGITDHNEIIPRTPVPGITAALNDDPDAQKDPEHRVNKEVRQQAPSRPVLPEDGSAYMVRAESRQRAKKKLRKEDRKIQRRVKREEKAGMRHLKSSSQEAPEPPGPVKGAGAPTQLGVKAIDREVCRQNPLPIITSIAGGRHVVRQRYIRQKKLAMTDMKALNEILMIKT